MSSREDILNRVRQRIGRTAQNTEAARARMREWLARRAPGPRSVGDGDLLMRLREKSEKMSSTVDAVAEPSAVPRAAARYLEANALPRRAVCAAELIHLDWHAAGIAVEARAARDDDLVGITGCLCAIAETGTLVLCSRPLSPASISLLPETHIAVVDAAHVVLGMEEAWQRVRAEYGHLPRAVNFVSGPSRTGDIEQTIVLGAHGPYRVHLILVTGR